jgi:hypothetical protein
MLRWDCDLKQARQAAYKARAKVASGGDPALDKRKQKIRSEFLSAQIFETVAREYIDEIEPFEVLAPLKRLEAKCHMLKCGSSFDPACT